ncbi:MAG: hypothetical protein GEV03_25710 [Streptosporangiales bacterium]|nr:hypothetical protein [Streptosporangiales bacterium]
MAIAPSTARGAEHAARAARERSRATDRTEPFDLAGVVEDLAADWERWAARVGVIPFEETLG